MSVRELVLLGTASQVPTRRRNHTGALLRWDDRDVLFDPGEGTQRQMTLAGVAATRIRQICLTHLHGDHCLGLPGVLQRMALDGVTHPVHLHFPASGEPWVRRLMDASVHAGRLDVRLHPTEGVGDVVVDGLRLRAEPLEHSIDTLGWRVEEPDGVRMLPDALTARGVTGPDVGRLQRDGTLETPEGTVTLDAVSHPRPGQRVAFVMDTAPCDGAERLAAGADLLITESTYQAADADLAAAHRHLTSDDAGRIAAAAGARRLVLMHFSQRYDDPSVFGREARAHHDDVVVGEDLDRIPVPPRP